MNIYKAYSLDLRYDCNLTIIVGNDRDSFEVMNAHSHVYILLDEEEDMIDQLKVSGLPMKLTAEKIISKLLDCKVLFLHGNKEQNSVDCFPTKNICRFHVTNLKVVSISETNPERFVKH